MIFLVDNGSLFKTNFTVRYQVFIIISRLLGLCKVKYSHLVNPVFLYAMGHDPFAPPPSPQKQKKEGGPCQSMFKTF